MGQIIGETGVGEMGVGEMGVIKKLYQITDDVLFNMHRLKSYFTYFINKFYSYEHVLYSF